MTDDEIMRQLSQAVRDDDLLAAEEMVTTGQEQHPEWDWPFPATVLWIQRGQMRRSRSRPGNRPDGAVRRRVREPCTRTGRLPARWAATWPPSASRALRKLRVPAGPPCGGP